MRRIKRGNCVRCGRSVAEVGTLNYRRLCRDCALEVMVDALMQVSRKEGPYYEKLVEGQRRYREQLAKARSESDEPL